MIVNGNFKRLFPFQKPSLNKTKPTNQRCIESKKRAYLQTTIYKRTRYASYMLFVQRNAKNFCKQLSQSLRRMHHNYFHIYVLSRESVPYKYMKTKSICYTSEIFATVTLISSLCSLSAGIASNICLAYSSVLSGGSRHKSDSSHGASSDASDTPSEIMIT